MEIAGIHFFGLEVLWDSLEVTGLVFFMMVLVDWIDVRTRGKVQQWVSGHKLQQYFTTSLLGVTPGCTGSFMNVSLYMHGFLTLGAITGGMIATSGDAAFVMFAKFPKTALLLNILLLFLGIIFAFVTDFIVRRFKIKHCLECGLQVYHRDEHSMGHYLKEHVWGHIIKKHIGRVFLWTFFALLLIHFGLEYLNLQSFAKEHTLLLLIIAAVLGLIPDAAPQYVFVFMFSAGLIPFSVLLTSSMVQDGHGMLPLLSYSVRDSVIIKIFNLAFGLAVGLAVLGLGF
ncbi:MAG: putative manganese transporter [Calditrichia bacterium]